jgi:hypothetical protein
MISSDNHTLTSCVAIGHRQLNHMMVGLLGCSAEIPYRQSAELGIICTGTVAHNPIRPCHVTSCVARLSGQSGQSCVNSWKSTQRGHLMAMALMNCPLLALGQGSQVWMAHSVKAATVAHWCPLPATSHCRASIVESVRCSHPRSTLLALVLGQG